MSTLETDLVQAATGTNTALKLKGKGSGVVKIGDGELSFPDADGSSDQIIKTDGSGALSFADAAGGGPSQATQAALEAETNEDTYAPPDLIRHSPGVAKVWGSVDRSAGTPSLNSPSYNITSVADNGAAQTTITIATDFSSTVYAPGASGLTSNALANALTLAAGSFDVYVLNTAGGSLDTTDFSCWAFGDQA